jgi:phosphoribosylformylglycinamidine synthase subunit PurS
LRKRRRTNVTTANGATGQAWLAHVYVTLKPVVNDPQGLAITDGLHTMGYSSVEEVRAGKYLQVRLYAASQDDAQRLAEEMSDRLLANTVIENYRCVVEAGE